MKLGAFLLSTLIAVPLPAFAYHGHRQVYTESHCYRNVERYVPGYYNEYGRYVGGYVKNERKKVLCKNFINKTVRNHSKSYVDDNSCIEGGILGGIAGGGLGAVLSRGNGRLWAVPLGVVGGSIVGCQINGG